MRRINIKLHLVFAKHLRLMKIQFSLLKAVETFPGDMKNTERRKGNNKSAFDEI